MNFAIAENRAVLTLNRRHFIRLHQNHPSDTGIIVCKFDPNFLARAERIHKEIAGRDSLSGQLLRINRE
ncbi:MAG TPA: DUF5615 family PIN-like protein [Verrucomicrobiae bacterium]|nr:DUF5615 family PIN-like protein [Verrucomicrobiae bacterium]